MDKTSWAYSRTVVLYAGVVTGNWIVSPMEILSLSLSLNHTLSHTLTHSFPPFLHTRHAWTVLTEYAPKYSLLGIFFICRRVVMLNFLLDFFVSWKKEKKRIFIDNKV